MPSETVESTDGELVSLAGPNGGIAVGPFGGVAQPLQTQRDGTGGVTNHPGPGPVLEADREGLRPASPPNQREGVCTRMLSCRWFTPHL